MTPPGVVRSPPAGRREAPRLVLASGSPRRADVLAQLGLSVTVRPAHVDEARLGEEPPEVYVERLARAKAHAVALEEPGALVIGGDTVVVHGGDVLGKPTGPADARSMLLRLSDGSHEVLSGIAVAGPHGVVSTVDLATVRFRPVDALWAERYVATGEPLDKAGAYGIQGLGAALVEAVDGDYYTIVGFPVRAFVGLLGQAGWRYDFGTLTRIAPL